LLFTSKPSTSKMSDSSRDNLDNFLRLVPTDSIKDGNRKEESDLQETPKPFNLSLKTERARAFLQSESEKSGISRTAYINELLLLLSSFPTVFASESDSSLEELAACKTLLSDPLTSKVPELAASSRRDPAQMALYLMERGLGVVETGSRRHHRRIK